MEEPLLSAENQNEQGVTESWSPTYAYPPRPASVVPKPSLPGTTEVSIDEIRSAAAAASSPYPPSLHAPLVSSPQSNQSQPHEPGFNYHGGYYGEVARAAGGVHRQVLDEVEIRKLLVDHVGHHWCWGNRPARTWKIHAVEDCNVYVGTLETFIEEREMITETEPTSRHDIEGKDIPEVGLWDLDLRPEFPVLFIPHKESRIRVPHSNKIDKCPGCHGRGSVVCTTCNADQDPGFYKEGQMSQCPACYGRGLIAHKDGSDTICQNCTGNGKIPCATCESRGLIKCQTCQGCGALLSYKVGFVTWTTLTTRKVNVTSGAASVPDDVFIKARGVRLWSNQANQCTPAYFGDSYFLNKFSSEVIAERANVPPTARVVCERHTISVVPVTRVTMTHRDRSFSFYIIGCRREVYLRDYPSRFCCGLCSCLEWLNA